jgi:hypothetical protein
MLVARLEALNASLNAHAFLGVQSNFDDAEFVHKTTGTCTYAREYDPFPFTMASTADYSNTRLKAGSREYICVSGTIAAKAFFTNNAPITWAKLHDDERGDIRFVSDRPQLTFITPAAYDALPRSITVAISTDTDFQQMNCNAHTNPYNVCFLSPADVLALFYANNNASRK